MIELLRKAARAEVVENLPLAGRTSVRVGGAARFLVRPQDPAALVAVLGVLSDAGIGWHVLGGGANTIVGDGGIDGAVLVLARDFCVEEIVESRDAGDHRAEDHLVITLGAGVPNARFLALAKEQRGVGVAWVAGIPGTVGGMVAMNAGTPSGCMADHLLAVEVATPDGLRWIDATELHLAYRHCDLPKGAVLTRARCQIWRGSEPELLEQQRAAKADVDRRRQTQPLTLPNSGSVFINPRGDFAGRLVERAGLKGARRGGAQISERHANFIVNTGDARASDVIELISLARSTVRAATGVELVPEVRLVGTFTPPLPQDLERHHILPVLLERGAMSTPGLALPGLPTSSLRVRP